MPPTEYPHAWRGPLKSSVMPQAEIDKLRCSFEGCERNWRSPGGLSRYGGGGEWRCADHRNDYDNSSHRADLRAAHQRGVDAAVNTERERIIRLLMTTDTQQVLDSLLALRPKTPAPAPAVPPVPEGS